MRYILPFLILLSGCGGYLRSYDYSTNQKAVLQYQRACELKTQEKYEDAINEFKRFLDYYSDIYFADECYFHLADCWRLLHQFPEAREHYKQLIKKKKNSSFVAEARFRTGECWEAESNYLKAVSAYKVVIEKHYQNEWAKRSIEKCNQIFAKFPEAKWAKKEKKVVEKLIKKLKKI
ncbi:tetratricopeptide repeat protein [bacterium]|nr:tetratricopeptide repeat protein [bacterium]MBU1600206.1 tetratricopeptide repeat protein [bacterium]MBU2462029.1 tetratricopeptide repeat protein [bacterium]